MSNTEVVFWEALAIGFIVHLLTTLLLGRKADSLPGGAVGAAVMFAPAWVTIPAALIGHACGVCLRRGIAANLSSGPETACRRQSGGYTLSPETVAARDKLLDEWEKIASGAEQRDEEGFKVPAGSGLVYSLASQEMRKRYYLVADMPPEFDFYRLDIPPGGF